MKIKNTYNYTISKYYICALIYGDLSGIENEKELNEVKKFIEKIGVGTIEILENSEDFRTCEITGLKSDTIDINVHYF